ARNAAAARRVRHQHAIAARERDVSRERGALVATFFLDHLHQDDLAALDDLLDLVMLAARPALLRTLAAKRLRGLIVFMSRLLGMFRHGRGFGGALFVHHALRKFFLDQRHVARQRVGHRLHADLRQIETNFGGGLLIDHALFGFFFRDHLERRLVDRVIFVVLRRKILGLLDIETGFYFGRRRLVVFVVMFLVTVFVE